MNSTASLAVIDAHIERAWMAADKARAEYARMQVAGAAWLLRQALPSATEISIDTSDSVPLTDRNYCHVTLISVCDSVHTLWHTDGDMTGIGDVLRQEIEARLTNALSFGLDHDSLDDLGWRRVDGEYDLRDITLPGNEQLAQFDVADNEAAAHNHADR